MKRQWFLSDLHLAQERPHTLALFEQFMRELPQPGDQVYILGDLFDLWIGDDDDAQLAHLARQAIRGAVDRGVGVSVQRGNRDIALGRRFSRETGATRLPDRFVTSVAGQPTLLMHGDLLCTDDVEYQKTRRRFSNPLFQWIMLRKSLAERRRITAGYRRRSNEAKAMKSESIMDVNDETVLRHLQKYRVGQMIHGHTHRPATHRHTLADGKTATRLVLPEWHGDSAQLWVDDGESLQPRQIELH